MVARILARSRPGYGRVYELATMQGRGGPGHAAYQAHPGESKQT